MVCLKPQIEMMRKSERERKVVIVAIVRQLTPHNIRIMREIIHVYIHCRLSEREREGKQYSWIYVRVIAYEYFSVLFLLFVHDFEKKSNKKLDI